MPGYGGIPGGAASGAAIGSNFGPIGTGIGAGLGSLVGYLTGGDSNKPVSPEVEQLLNWEFERQQRANPLVEQVFRQAFSRLPESARAGLSVPSFAGGGWSGALDHVTSSGGDEDYAQSPAMRRLIRLQMLRMRMADPILQAVQHLAQARMPMGYQKSGSPSGPPDLDKMRRDAEAAARDALAHPPKPGQGVPPIFGTAATMEDLLRSAGRA